MKDFHFQICGLQIKFKIHGPVLTILTLAALFCKFIFYFKPRALRAIVKYYQHVIQMKFPVPAFVI